LLGCVNAGLSNIISKSNLSCDHPAFMCYLLCIES